MHIVAPGCAVKVGVGADKVVKAAVLLETEEEQPVEVKAIPVILTTLDVPALFNADVENVPVPGLPAVKLIEAVVEPTVFVPLTSYVTV